MSTKHDPTALAITRLEEASCYPQRHGRSWSALCPVHDDSTPSLSIAAGRTGVLIHCHAGCDTPEVLAAIGLRAAEMFYDYEPRDTDADQWHHIRAWKMDSEKEPRAPKPNPYRRNKTDYWDYYDADGLLVGRVVRFDLIDRETGEITGKKTFTQQAWDSATESFLPSLDGRKLPLYNLPRVIAAIANGMPVMVCEGERDADTATRLGLVATTNSQGAGSWMAHHAQEMTGARQVFICADDDKPGMDHARTVMESLRAIGVPDVRIVKPALGKDLTDHVSAGLGIADLIPVDMRAEDEKARDEIRARFPTIDWAALWADETEEGWIVEPLVPERRLVALYSAPKVGKSLLMLEIAAAVASGRSIFGCTTTPRPVLYVDFENDPRSDIRTRLQAMGYNPCDLDNLHYLSFPDLASLDSDRGGLELMEAVGAYGAEVVVIDTVSRAVAGEENENDTWLAFYRSTGLLLKRAGVALIRLDHSGKDEGKGQRGGSAKAGDVDAVWRMSKVTEDTLQLTCEMSRFTIHEKSLLLKRQTIPRLEHIPMGTGNTWEVRVTYLIKWLDANDVPPVASNRETGAALRAGGHRVGSDLVAEIVRRRTGTPKQWEMDA